MVFLVMMEGSNTPEAGLFLVINFETGCVPSNGRFYSLSRRPVFYNKNKYNICNYHEKNWRFLRRELPAARIQFL